MKQYFKINYSENDKHKEPVTAIIGIDNMPSEYESCAELRTNIANALNALIGIENPFVFSILPLGSEVEFINI